MAEAETLALLRRGLDDGTLLNGNRVLPERQLALRLGTSRARLRSALDILETEGRIFRRHGQGTFVAPPPAIDSGQLQTLARQVTPGNVMEVRLEVEPALAALAAQRATADEIDALYRLMQATLRAADMAAYEAADDVFHFKIAELAHNPLFLTIHQSIRAVRRHAQWTDRRRETYTPERILQLGEQHEALFQHIASHHASMAAQLMEEHLITVSNAMLRDRGGPRIAHAAVQRTT